MIIYFVIITMFISILCLFIIYQALDIERRIMDLREELLHRDKQKSEAISRLSRAVSAIRGEIE